MAFSKNASERTKKRSTSSQDIDSSKRRKLSPEQQAPASTAQGKDSNKKAHVRFGSEEPESQEVQTTVVVPVDRVEEEEESDDDDAPEEISGSIAHAQKQEEEAQTAASVQQQRTAAKNKRRERDALLKKQAESAKRKKDVVQEKDADEDDDSQDDADDVMTAKVKATRRASPDLLPDDVLADEPLERSPTPDPKAKTAQSELLDKKRKRIVFGPKKPKDRRVGPVSVSVLEKTNRFLPPKANLESKQARERWLKGQKKSRFGIPDRVEVRHGFLRN